MDERLAQIKDLIGQINTIIAEIEGENTLSPEEQKVKEKERYLGMKPEERESADRKKMEIDKQEEEE